MGQMEWGFPSAYMLNCFRNIEHSIPFHFYCYHSDANRHLNAHRTLIWGTFTFLSSELPSNVPHPSQACTFNASAQWSLISISSIYGIFSQNAFATVELSAPTSIVYGQRNCSQRIRPLQRAARGIFFYCYFLLLNMLKLHTEFKHRLKLTLMRTFMAFASGTIRTYKQMKDKTRYECSSEYHMTMREFA